MGNRMRRRRLAFLLIIVLCWGLLPGSAFSEGNPEPILQAPSQGSLAEPEGPAPQTDPADPKEPGQGPDVPGEEGEPAGGEEETAGQEQEAGGQEEPAGETEENALEAQTPQTPLFQLAQEQSGEYRLDLRGSAMAIGDDDKNEGKVKFWDIHEELVTGIDPAATTFTVTTEGAEVDVNGLGLEASHDLNVVLTDCKLVAGEGNRNPDASVWNTIVPDGAQVHHTITLAGENKLIGGNDRFGLQIPESAAYTIKGDGLLILGGGIAIGNGWGTAQLPAGDLRMEGGTIIAESSRFNKGIVNASVTYLGGSLNATAEDIKNEKGDPLYPVTLDFSDPYCMNFISMDGTKERVVVNGYSIILDEKKKAYIYLPEGDSAVSVSEQNGAVTCFTVSGVGKGEPIEYAVNGEGEYILDLRKGDTAIKNGGIEGTVRVEVGGMEMFPSISPNTNFVFTTGGVELKDAVVAIVATVPLNLKLRNCKLISDAQPWKNPWNTVIPTENGAVNHTITLEGENALLGGSDRFGLHIPVDASYTIKGDGLLRVKGGAAIGNYGNNGPKSAGTLRMEGGRIIAEGWSSGEEGLINASVIYRTGLLRGNAPNVKNEQGESLYPVILDFSHNSCQTLLSQNGDSVEIDGYTVYLDADKKAILYLLPAENRLSLSVLQGSGKREILITPNTNNKIEIKVLLSTSEVLVKERGYDTLTLQGNWDTQTKDSMKWIEYREVDYNEWLRSEETAIYEPYLSVMIKNLRPGATYICRAAMKDQSDQKIHYSSPVTVTLLQPFNLSVQKGTVIAGEAVPSLGKYIEGTEITVNADQAGSNEFFEAWYDENHNLVSTQQVYTFTIKKNTILIAKYSQYAPPSGSLHYTLSHDREGDATWYFTGGGTQGTLRSGMIGDEENSSLIATISVPEGKHYIISFDWMVSSEADCDVLRVYKSTNGQSFDRLYSISGTNKNWKEKLIYLESGIHNIEWEYKKDLSQMKGEDCGYLRNIVVREAESFSITAKAGAGGSVSLSPNTGLYPEASTVTLTAAPNENYYFKEWQDSSGNPVSRSMVYQFMVAGDASFTAVFEAIPDYSLLVTEGKDWIEIAPTKGNPWQIETNGGRYVGKSGYTDDNQESALTADIIVPEGDAVLFFDWKVSSELDCDGLQVSLFDVETNTDTAMQAITGTGGDWITTAIPLKNDFYQIEWNYLKDDSYKVGEDCGYLRNIRVVKADSTVVSVKATVNNDAYGTCTIEPNSEQGTYPVGTQITLKARPWDGYVFKGWRKGENGPLISVQPYLIIGATEDLSLIAEFAPPGIYYDSVKKGWNVLSLFSGSLTAIYAAYDSSGRMSSCLMEEEVILEGGNWLPVPAGFNIPAGGRVKLILVADTKSMEPVF